MTKKVITTIKEYDEKGNLLKVTTKEETETEEEIPEINFPHIPYYYPIWEPETTGKHWWENPMISYSCNGTYK